eukprot:5848228-Alexandrium_andersonii.AAC.1
MDVPLVPSKTDCVCEGGRMANAKTNGQGRQATHNYPNRRAYGIPCGAETPGNYVWVRVRTIPLVVRCSNDRRAFQLEHTVERACSNRNLNHTAPKAPSKQ